MSQRGRVAAFTALLGFLGCTLGTACLLATACPSHSCEPCPVVFCHSVAANASPKVDVALGPTSGNFQPFHLIPAGVAVIADAQIPPFLPHEFRRPMRN